MDTPLIFFSFTFFKQAHKFFLNVHQGKQYEWIDGCTFQLHAFLILLLPSAYIRRMEYHIGRGSFPKPNGYGDWFLNLKKKRLSIMMA